MLYGTLLPYLNTRVLSQDLQLSSLRSRHSVPFDADANRVAHRKILLACQPLNLTCTRTPGHPELHAISKKSIH